MARGYRWFTSSQRFPGNTDLRGRQTRLTFTALLIVPRMSPPLIANQWKVWGELSARRRWLIRDFSAPCRAETRWRTSPVDASLRDQIASDCKNKIFLEYNVLHFLRLILYGKCRNTAFLCGRCRTRASTYIKHIDASLVAFPSRAPYASSRTFFGLRFFERDSFYRYQRVAIVTTIGITFQTSRLTPSRYISLVVFAKEPRFIASFDSLASAA